MNDCVIDISHHNGKDLDFDKAKADGIEGVIHKATQGTSYSDPRFEDNQEAIRQAGLLFGAYHFGTGNASGRKQAEYFLAHVDPKTTLCALDFEPNEQGPDMSIAQAIEFCEVVEEKSGRPCVVYTGAPMLPQLTKLNNGERPLWWAQYSARPSKAPKDWPVVLWQYTDKGWVDGIGECDRNKFNGEALDQLWGISEIEKPPDPEKGVTTGAKPANETAGTPPPAPAAEVKASQPSWFTRIGSLSVPASTMAILSAIGKFVMGLPAWAWVVIVVASMVIGYLIWREAKRQAHERTLLVMRAAADKDSNNLRLV